MKEKAKTEEKRPMGNKREGERGERVREDNGENQERKSINIEIQKEKWK